MIPTYSAGLAIAVLVIFVLAAVGLVAIVAAVNELAARWIGREAGCLVGGVVGCAWVWLIVQVEDAGLPVYAAVLVGIPIALTVAARATRT